MFKLCLKTRLTLATLQLSLHRHTVFRDFGLNELKKKTLSLVKPLKCFAHFFEQTQKVMGLTCEPGQGSLAVLGFELAIFAICSSMPETLSHTVMG